MSARAVRKVRRGGLQLFDFSVVVIDFLIIYANAPIISPPSMSSIGNGLNERVRAAF